jgi:L-ascorbate metabolism protein UlaG (beta-lactamase superfamily)
MMKIFLQVFVVAALAGLIFPGDIHARCAPDLVNAPRTFRAVPVKSAPPARISIEWFGHSFFRLVSAGGIRVIADPFGPEMRMPVPAVRPDAVTVGREHPHHNSAGIAAGNPRIFRGLGGGEEWAKIQETVGDVLIYNVPVVQRTYEMRTKGSAFVYEIGGLCIAHLGDVAEALTPSQLRRLGKIHVAMVPIGGTFAVGPDGARRLVGQIRPHIAIPMHYWDEESLLRRFLRGARRVKKLERGPLYVTKRKLPPPTLIVVMSRKGI